MGLLSWLVPTGRDTIRQITLAWLVTSVIGFSRLHHSIVGTVEVLAGILLVRMFHCEQDREDIDLDDA